MIIKTTNPIVDSVSSQFKTKMAEDEGYGEYDTSGGGSWSGTHLNIDGDEQFKREMSEGEGEYDTAGGGRWMGTQYGADGEVQDNFKTKQIGAGGLTISTENPVYEDTAIQEHEWLSSASGPTRRARRRSKKSKRGSKRGGGNFWDKLKGGIQKVSDSGILQQIGGAVQGGMQEDPAYGIGDTSFEPTPIITTDPPKTGMSTGAKIGIAVGVVAVIGIGAYFVMKNKGGKSSKK